MGGWCCRSLLCQCRNLTFCDDWNIPLSGGPPKIMVRNWPFEILNPFLFWRYHSALSMIEGTVHPRTLKEMSAPIAHLQVMFNASLQSTVKFVMWIFIHVNVMLEISSDLWSLSFGTVFTAPKDQWGLYCFTGHSNLYILDRSHKRQVARKSQECPRPSVNLGHLRISISNVW